MTKGTYYKYKAEGKCINCGEKLPYGYKYVMCEGCRSSKKKLWYKRREDKVKLPEQHRIRNLDEMAKEAHLRHISYGRLQSEETIDWIRRGW